MNATSGLLPTAVFGEGLHPIKLGEANEDATSGTITSFVLIDCSSYFTTRFIVIGGADFATRVDCIKDVLVPQNV